MGIIWIILIGLVAGIIARFLSPGPNNPSGFILTAVLGIGGAFLATWIGRRLAGIGQTRVRALSGLPSAHCWSCLSGTGSSPRGSFPIPGLDHIVETALTSVSQPQPESRPSRSK